MIQIFFHDHLSSLHHAVAVGGVSAGDLGAQADVDGLTGVGIAIAVAVGGVFGVGGIIALGLVIRTGAGDQTGDHYEDKQKRDQLFHWLFSL